MSLFGTTTRDQYDIDIVYITPKKIKVEGSEDTGMLLLTRVRITPTLTCPVNTMEVELSTTYPDGIPYTLTYLYESGLLNDLLSNLPDAMEQNIEYADDPEMERFIFKGLIAHLREQPLKLNFKNKIQEQ